MPRYPLFSLSFIIVLCVLTGAVCGFLIGVFKNELGERFDIEWLKTMHEETVQPPASTEEDRAEENTTEIKIIKQQLIDIEKKLGL